MNLDVPEADDVTQGWWDATRHHRFVLQRCGACGFRQHPPRALCTECYRDGSLSFEEACGQGVVDAATVVHRAPRPDVHTPYVIARIRLKEGPIVLSRVGSQAAGEVLPGTQVRLAWLDLDDGRALPVFEIAKAKEPTQPEEV